MSREDPEVVEDPNHAEFKRLADKAVRQAREFASTVRILPSGRIVDRRDYPDNEDDDVS